MKNFLNELQNKPYETRVRILWGTTALVAAIIIGIWALSLRTTIGGAGPITFAPPTEETPLNQPETELITIERAERFTGGVKVYFNINNTTDDILNFSKLEDITMNTTSGPIKPTAALDRQGMPLVQKVLSHTQVFGTLVFPDITDDQPQLVFGSMLFEKSPNEPLKQTHKLDMPTLEKNSEVRN